MNSYRVSIAGVVSLLPAVAAMAQEGAAAGPSPDALIMRWLHVLGAVMLLGAGIFMRFVLMPSASTLPAEQHDQLRAAVRSRWSKFVHVLVVVLLVTGFYNYLVANKGAHSGQGQYHMLMGIKILLAFGVFFLASILAGKTSLAQKFQANGKLWMLVTVALGVTIVLIAGYLKFIPAVH